MRDKRGKDSTVFYDGYIFRMTRAPHFFTIVLSVRVALGGVQVGDYNSTDEHEEVIVGKRSSITPSHNDHTSIINQKVKRK